MTTLQRTVDRGFANVGEEFEKLRSQIANNVLVTMKAMANEAKNGPRLFTIEPVDENDNGSTRNTNYNFGAKPKIANILCMTAWAFTNSR
jgi:hypothetical protein